MTVAPRITLFNAAGRAQSVFSVGDSVFATGRGFRPHTVLQFTLGEKPSGLPARYMNDRPGLRVGRLEAESVSIASDGRWLRGILRELPPDGAVVTVGYGQCQLGTTLKAFRRKRVEPLPREC